MKKNVLIIGADGVGGQRLVVALFDY